MKCGDTLGRLAAFSLCLLLLPFCQSSSIHVGQRLTTDQEVVDEMLLLHSMYRGNVTPTAANMHPLVWDDDLAEAAQNFSLLCSISFDGHSSIPGFTTVGRTFSNNDPALGVAVLYRGAVNRWVSRVESYNHSEDICTITTSQCESYRQMIWAESRVIGCGAVLCPPETIIPFQATTFLNCFYGPREGMRPYIIGPPCSMCRENHTECRNNLCTLQAIMEPDSPMTTDINYTTTMNTTAYTTSDGGSGYEHNDTDTTTDDNDFFDMDTTEDMRIDSSNGATPPLSTGQNLFLLCIILVGLV